MPLLGLLGELWKRAFGDLCGHVQGSAEELQGARGSLGLLQCSLSFLGKVQ